MQRTFLILTVLLGFLGCSSVPMNTALDRVKPGMDKAAVLEVAGNPKRTYREQGEDHWVYVFFESQRELSREIVFESGKVEKVGPPRAKTNWDKEMENLQHMKNDSGFQSLDSGS